MTNKNKHVIFLFKICNKNKYLYYIIMKDSIFLVYVRKCCIVYVRKCRLRHEVTLNRYKAESEIFGGNGVPGNDFNTVPAEKG